MSAKKTKASGQRHFSVNDMLVEKFEKNKKKIQELLEENNRIKDQWKHKGSFATNNFVVEVNKKKETRALSVKEGLEKYGEAFFAYCKEVERWNFKVKKRG